MMDSEGEVPVSGASKDKSSCSSNGDSITHKMEDENSKESSQLPGSKRMLSIDDPDYLHPPDAKRMREMHRRAQDELSERVVKVVDKEFHYAMNEKQAELEEIDSRILRLQQCLHTLRYCVSLNYYAVNKHDGVSSKQKQMLHPAVRKHLGKAPVMRQTSSTSLIKSTSNRSFFQKSPECQSFGTSRLPQAESKGSTEKISVKLEHTLEEENVESYSSGSERISNSLEELHKTVNDKCQDRLDSINEEINKNCRSPRPPSPKYLPPKPPDNPQTIFQGRHQRFQSKRRVVVGNTYQYLTSHGDEDVGETLRYKWQVYVRAPMQGEDVSSFISAVTFILDQSYAPHHVITLKHPPFVLTRRGWGEFKIQIVLRFTDTRNKQVRLLHPLVLSRQDDPLALTGLWRLGQENWYDLWVYEPDSHMTGNENGSQHMTEVMVKEENCPAALIKELESGVVSSQVEENITVVHSVGQSSLIDIEKDVAPVKQENIKRLIVSTDKSTIIESVRKHDSTSSCKQQSPTGSQSGNEIDDDVNLNKVENEKGKVIGAVESRIKIEGLQENKTQGLKPSKDHLGIKVTNVNGAQGKVCKIHVRQPDGRLVPYYIPAHMYSLALKIAQGGANKHENEVTSVGKKLINQQGIVSQQSVKQKIIKLHVPDNLQKGETEDITLRQESSEALTQQKEGSKLGILEIKAEVEQDNTKACVTPIKILNFSPNKNATKDIGGSITLAPSTSGIQGMPRPTLVAQGKQTVARLSTSRLPQSPLQQLLVKAAIQDKKHALVKQLISKKRLKDDAGDTMHTLQGQVTYTQTPVGIKPNIQLMPLKIVQEMQSAGTASSKIIQRPISAANIRFITNNGQLISAGKLARGKTCSASSKVTTKFNMATTAVPSTSKCILTTSSSSSAITSDNVSSSASLQGSQQVAGSSKGKIAPTQFSPTMVCNSTGDTGTVLQIPPFVVRGMGNGGALKAVSNSLKCTPSSAKNMAVPGVSLLRGITTAASPTVCSLLKPLTISTNAGVTSSTSVLTNVLTKVTSNPPVMKSLTLNASTPDKTRIALVKLETLLEDHSKEEDGTTTQEWEERVRQLEAVCRTCTSADTCVYIWVRAMPLVASRNDCSRVFPFCARSNEEFLCWPLGKQRAAEFQKAREVKYRLDQCQVEGREGWSVARIVAWARRHAHTPTQPRVLLRTDNFLSSVTTKPDKTLSYLGNLEKFVQVNNQMTSNGKVGLQEVDVVTVDDEIETSRQRKLSVSAQKRPLEFVPWEDSQMVSGCEWVGHHTSQLRLSFATEEIIKGYTVDAARATLWRAMLSLMDDLIRSSHCEAWGETVQPSSDPPIVPPHEITLHHVLRALTGARPEFDIFTDYGLGTPVETCMDNAP